MGFLRLLRGSSEKNCFLLLFFLTVDCWNCCGRFWFPFCSVILVLVVFLVVFVPVLVCYVCCVNVPKSSFVWFVCLTTDDCDCDCDCVWCNVSALYTRRWVWEKSVDVWYTCGVVYVRCECECGVGGCVGFGFGFGFLFVFVLFVDWWRWRV